MWITELAVILVALLAVVFAAPRISGSKIASQKQFPYQVALITQSAWCGGVLISKDWILTSAQCIERTKTLTAVLGAQDILSDEESQVKVDISMNNVYLHEDWDSDTSVLNDIAAVGLPLSIQFTDYIKPVTLPRVNHAGLSFDGLDGITSGWSYEKSSELRYGTANIAKQNDCALYFQDEEMDSTILCLHAVDDACLGDLGSPLVSQDASSTLIGLASFGWSSGCSLGEPALFTSVTSYVRWIYETTGVINNRF